MTMEFEGRTEREAVAKAAAELGSESFDVEVLEKGGGLFGKGKVRISVRKLSSIPNPMGSGDSSGTNREKRKVSTENKAGQGKVSGENREEPTGELLKRITDFVEGIMKRMGYPSELKFKKEEEGKLIFEVNSVHSAILIGRKGRNLDSLQLLANVYLGKIDGEYGPWRIILDSEGYRARREKSLIRMAHRVADETVKKGSSKLLEPLNPYERRLIHTVINNREDVITQSEGTGLYKRVRIIAGKAGENNRDKID